MVRRNVGPYRGTNKRNGVLGLHLEQRPIADPGNVFLDQVKHVSEFVTHMQVKFFISVHTQKKHVISYTLIIFRTVL